MRLRALLFLLTATAVHAQTAEPDSTFDTVTVTAARVGVATAEAAVRVDVLDRDDAEAAGAQTVADLIEARSGVFVRRYGPGGLASASLRGASASQTLVLLDGHRIADPQLGQLDLSLLPAVLFDRAEVLYGPGSALYGTDGVGGVVNLRTGRGATGVTVEARGGAWGARGASVLGEVDGRVGGVRLGARAVVDAEAAEGNYAYFDSTRFDNEAGRVGMWATREGADERRLSFFGQARAETERVRSAVGVWRADAERGLFAPSGAPGQRQWDRSLRVWTDHEVRLGATRLAVGGLAQQSRLVWTPREAAVGDSGRARTLTAHARIERPVTTAFPARGVWTLSAGGQVGTASAEHPSLGGDARERSGAAFASAVADYGRVRLYPALRLDAVRTPGPEADETLVALSPALGMNVGAVGPLRLKASARRAFRAPTFNDRFWEGAGDPALRPEVGWTVDGGAVLPVRLGAVAAEAEATVFGSTVRDQIVWKPGVGGVWRPENVGRVRTLGAEASASVRAPLGRGAAFRLDALVTLTDSRDRTNSEASSYDQPLLYVPDRQAKGTLSVGWPALMLDVEAVHTGRRFTASDGSASLAPVTVGAAQVRARLAVAEAVGTLAVRVENLGDRRYEVVRGYPMPPRHLSVRLSLTAR